MPFIRSRISQTKRYGETKSHQLIETYRENGKVKQRVLANLGSHPTVEEALEHTRKAIEWTRGALARRKTQGPRGGGRLARCRERHLAWWRRRLARQETHLRALEAVVSKSARRRDIVDTTSCNRGVVSESRRRQYNLDTTNESVVSEPGYVPCSTP